MPNIREIIISDGALPVCAKPIDKPAFVYSPTKRWESAPVDKDKFMIPYYRVKKNEVESWANKLQTEMLLPQSPPIGHKEFEIVILSFFDQDGGEPRFGAALVPV
jgi:hypothetical protein